MEDYILSLIEKIKGNRLILGLISLVLVAAIVFLVVTVSGAGDKKTEEDNSSKVSASAETKPDESSSEQSSSEVQSSELSSQASSSSTSSKKPSKVTYSSTWVPPFGTDYKYNTKLDVNDNVFMDSLIYTGYNIKKHRSDGLMWEYVLAANKRGKGWLSKISYDYDGSTTGYETNSQGLPDIAYFENKDLVCASYATYVYFNFLPNVAGIDTSNLTKPEKPMLAQDWYIAAKDWVKKGYSKSIDFTAKPGWRIDFKPKEEIPIGSIISFCDYKNKKVTDYSRHVVIYAGYVNGQHWVYQVGNDNGPEFCTVERMICGADPMFPISVISTPSTVMQHFEQ